MNERQVFDFPGEQTDVQWDQRLCIHVAECGQAKGDLFVTGRQPWCIPDTSAPEEIAKICQRCPSGALTFTDKSDHSEQALTANSVHVSNSGPLYAHGELAIEGAADDMPGVRYRAALCRCGQSNNKPFCDNSHQQAGFQDYGAVGESGPGFKGNGGQLNIKPVTNGPLLLSGKLTLTAGSGRVAWQGESLALCRCGESQNKPFCDGSHKAAGFRSS